MKINLNNIFDDKTISDAYEIANLQSLLLNINSDNFEIIKKFIISSRFIHTKKGIKKLANQIIFAVSSRYMSIPLYSKLTREIFYMQNQNNKIIYLKNIFFPIIVPRLIDSRTLYFLYFCMDGEYINKMDIVSLIKKSLEDEPDQISELLTLFCFFAPEVEELDSELYFQFLEAVIDDAQETFSGQYVKQFVSEIDQLHVDKWKLLKERRESMQSGDILIDSLFSDSIDDFQYYVSHCSNDEFDLNQMINESIFTPPHMFMKSLIEFAARCGSIKCFKYLLLNGAGLGGAVESAIIGGNNEIVRLLKQKGCDFSCGLNVAAKSHRNDIFQWLINTDYPIDNNINRMNAIFGAVESCNLQLILFLIEKGIDFNIRNLDVCLIILEFIFLF